MLADVKRLHPAGHYVMVDDKLRILEAMKKGWGDRLTTIFVRQGHDALDKERIAGFPPADITIEHISDLTNLDLATLLAPARRR
jgi:hypothetical protein